MPRQCGSSSTARGSGKRPPPVSRIAHFVQLSNVSLMYCFPLRWRLSGFAGGRATTPLLRASSSSTYCHTFGGPSAQATPLKRSIARVRCHCTHVKQITQPAAFNPFCIPRRESSTAAGTTRTTRSHTTTSVFSKAPPSPPNMRT